MNALIKSMVATLIFRAVLGGYAFHYALTRIFAQDVPWWVDGMAGFLIGRPILFVAVAALVLRYCDLNIPLWDWIVQQKP